MRKFCFEIAREAADNESIFENPWFTASMLTLLVAALLVLLIVYMPRAEEIRNLRKRVDEQAATIDRMSRGQTQAELEHVADIEQIKGDHAMNMQRVEGRATEATIRAKNAEARTNQSEDLRRQIAYAADKLTKEARA